MSALENLHCLCRVCASLKSSAKLVNLILDEEMRNSIVNKLNRFNINVNFNCPDDGLPWSICLTCINSLDKAFDFICEVEKAQKVLENLIDVKYIKTENQVSDDDIYESSSPVLDVNIKIKSENDTQLSTIKDVKTEKVVRLKKKATKVEKLDGVPLAQLKMSWKDYDWQCAYCDTLFPTIDELKSHSLQFHECCNPYRCTDCNIRKLKLDSFIAHVKRHRKYLKLSCFKCHKKFTKTSQVRNHYNTHIKTKHTCTGCNETFVSPEELVKHSNSYNRDLRIRQFPPMAMQSLNDGLTCTICQKSFKYKGTLINHLLIHTDRKREHTCEKCGKRFLSKQNLAGHMMLHDDVRPYPCEICKFRFRTSGQLRMHVGIHDGVKPFECDQCGRCFRLRKQLMNHSIIHTDTMPYICSYCNKGFRFKSILNQHIRQHTGVKPYSCQKCERRFTNWPNYNKHMKRRHDTNMAKKKRTPKGVYPIDPATGEMITYEETNKTNEWKKVLLEGSRKRGRPKLNHKNSSINKTANDMEQDIVNN